jgi:hypothetical protein
VPDTFCAPYQQAGEGEADEMVHSIPTEAEIQGTPNTSAVLPLFWLGPTLVCMQLHPMVSHLLFVHKIIKEISTLVLTRGPKLCNFVDWQGYRVVYKR